MDDKEASLHEQTMNVGHNMWLKTVTDSVWNIEEDILKDLGIHPALRVHIIIIMT